MSDRTPPMRRDDFNWFHPITTRWHDNDLYGHVNNVIYYSYFDTVIGAFAVNEAGLDPWKGDVIGLCVESGCRYHAQIAFPEEIEAGLAIEHLGTSSVRYQIGIFGEGEETARADGFFVHVFVNRQTNKPSPVPAHVRAVYEKLQSGRLKSLD